MKLSKEEKAKLRAEEKEREELRQAEKRKRLQKGCLLYIVIVVILAIWWALAW